MIGIKVQGRLGNQMFQYAFGYAISRKLHTQFFLDETESSTTDLKNFFELKSYPNLLNIKFKQFVSNLLNSSYRIVEVDHGESFESILINDKCLYKGFFQSENYFHEYIEQVKAEFKIKKKHLINVRNHLNITDNKPLIVAHVRRTDYQIHGSENLGGKDLTLPMNYYKICLQQIEDLENYNLVFVTDDKEYVFNNFHQNNPIISSSNSSIVDFQILMDAEIIILANSSFSWWGAYLNKKATRILAPKYWLGFKVKKDYPENLIPPNWETFEF